MSKGNDPFVNALQPLLEASSGLQEFPREQKLMNRPPPLDALFPDRVKESKALRDDAIHKACADIATAWRTLRALQECTILQ